MAVRIKTDNRMRAKLLASQKAALRGAMVLVLADLKASQTVPFETGALEEQTTLLWDEGEGHAVLVSDTPYAARLYFHPAYRFETGLNENAGAYWFESYINGGKRQLLARWYGMLLKKEIGKM